MYLPESTDYRDVSQLTANFSTLDGSVGALGAGMAIVSVGNTHAAIASGQYVYIMNHASLSEGLYKATSAISANTTLSGSNVTAVSGGGLNELISKIITYRKKSVTLGQDNTATVTDIILSGECGVLFVQQNSFMLNNLGYIALVRRLGDVFYITEVPFTGTETLRPSLSSSGVLSVTSTSYSGSYRCLFVVF